MNKRYFAVFENEEARTKRDLNQTKASAGVLTISALVPDPKKPGYVCLQYQPSKNAKITDLYFEVKNSEIFTEAMHVMIECVRKRKQEEHDAKKAGGGGTGGAQADGATKEEKPAKAAAAKK